MKRKAVIAVLAAVIMALGAVSVLAMDFSAPENATEVTSRFFLVECDTTGNEFTMAGQDGTLIIHITDNTPVYFEYALPISDECDGVTSAVRELLFGQTLAEVLEGRNLRVLFEQSEQVEPISVIVLFEAITTGPATLYPEDDYMGIMALPGEIEYMGILIPPADVEWADLAVMALNGEIVVNNEILEDAPLPFWYEADSGDVVMVPLGAVVNALGYDVSWDYELQSVRLGLAIQI